MPDNNVINVFENKKTLDSWDQDYYNDISEHFYDSCIAKMLRLMEIGPGEKLLDAGCGPGVHSIRVARAGHPVCAIDISQTMLVEAEKRVRTAGIEDVIQFKQEDLTHLSFPSKSFKFAFSWGVIIHIKEIELALSELARVITPGGKLALYVNNSNSIDLKLERLVRTLLLKSHSARETLPLGVGGWYTMHDERLWVWHFDIPRLAQFLEKHGLRLVHRSCGEFSEFQRRFTGSLRRALLTFNNFAFQAGFPAEWSVANLLIFEKFD